MQPATRAKWNTSIVRGEGIVGGEGDRRDTYNVVVMGNSGSLNALTVEIYNSNYKSWRIAGHLPEDVNPMDNNIIFYASSLYWPVIIHGEQSNLGFNLEEGTSTSLPFPNIDERGPLHPRMLTCGSQLLLAVGRSFYSQWV